MIKNILKKLFGKYYSFIYEELSYYYYRFSGCFFGRKKINQKLLKHLNYENGFFIELGANNGITQSNTLYYEIKKNWRGILIEPALNNYLKCLQNRNDKNFFYCNACVDFNYKEKYVDLTYANLMTLSSNLELDIINKANFLKDASEFVGNNEIVHFGSRAVTLDYILNDAKAPKVIDLLSLDVEGAELSVLKGVNFKKYIFKFILLESRNIDPIKKYLSSKGYKLIETLNEPAFDKSLYDPVIPGDYLFKFND